jgi:acetyl-CoA carboxylase carboxyltransferase component
MSADDRTKELRQKKKEARQNVGPERIAARRRQGTGSARERVDRLFDPESFVELDVFVAGVVTGYGLVAGRDVYVFSLDPDTPRSSLGSEYTKKLTNITDLALTNGAPLVGIYDGATDEGAGALGTDSGLLFRRVLASGVVPQIAAVVGPVGGAAAFSPVLADLVVMVKGTGRLLQGTRSDSAGEALESLGGARVLSEQDGVVHLAADDEEKCLEAVRSLLSYLPQDNLEDVPLSDTLDPVDRMDEELQSLAGGDIRHDVREIIGRVLDRESLLEILPEWGKSLVVGFARLGGRSVGVVANQPTELDGRLDMDAAAKGARFVRLCDAFNLPLVTFVDTPGCVSGSEGARGRVLRASAQLMYAFAEATVPKLGLIVGRALGEGFEIMSPKGLGADFYCAWPSAVMGAAAPGAAAEVDPQALYAAARAGHLDDIIEPVTSRPRLVAALEACVHKRESRPAKKHGNIPL